MYSPRTISKIALAAAFAIVTPIMNAPMAPASSASPLDAQVAKGKAELFSGKIDNAVADLTKASNALGMRPGSCDCHFHLGMALCKKAKAECQSDSAKSSHDYLLAKSELKKAIKVGAGNLYAKKANEYMMTNVPKDLLAPRNGEGTEMIAARLGLRCADRGAGEAAAKPKIFEFYADWCQPCVDLKKVMDKIQAQYGDQIELKAINVDDKTNADLVDQYDVSPIPTVIYMNPDGQVVGYSVGYEGDQSQRNVEKELAKLLPNKS